MRLLVTDAVFSFFWTRLRLRFCGRHTWVDFFFFFVVNMERLIPSPAPSHEF
jgi:hypothetical protein